MRRLSPPPPPELGGWCVAVEFTDSSQAKGDFHLAFSSSTSTFAGGRNENQSEIHPACIRAGSGSGRASHDVAESGSVREILRLLVLDLSAGSGDVLLAQKLRTTQSLLRRRGIRSSRGLPRLRVVGTPLGDCFTVMEDQNVVRRSDDQLRIAGVGVGTVRRRMQAVNHEVDWRKGGESCG